MNKSLRVLIILLVALIPATLMRETLMHLATHLTTDRFLRRLPRLLLPESFALWTVCLGLLMYSCVRWFKLPTRLRFAVMLFSVVALGSGFIWFLRVTFFFSTPGDGPIP